MKLHAYMSRCHLLADGSLVGPESGTRLNLRIGRFIKSYLPFVSFGDDRYYVQGQAYWISSSLKLYELSGETDYREAALQTAQAVLARQTEKGHWRLENPEWQGRITTVETCFGGLALINAYRASGDDRFLDGAMRAYNYLINDCGFRNYDDESICINYFSNFPSGLVPNNATLALWFFSELAEATHSDAYRRHCPEMVNFLVKCQMDSGELPYALRVHGNPPQDRPHYLCYQYNAFEFVDLCNYSRITNDERIVPVVSRLAGFLSKGLSSDGHANYNCFKEYPLVHYFTGAVSSALMTAHRAGLGDYLSQARKGFDWLIGQQRADGGFDYSTRDYRVLTDRRSYPRNLAMILRHLLVCVGAHCPESLTTG